MPNWPQILTCMLLILPAVSVSQAGGDKRAAEKQAEIKKLQKQRLDLLGTVLQIQSRQYAQGKMDFSTLAEAHRNLLVATIQVADTSEERIKALGEMQKLAEDVLKIVKARSDVGGERSKVDLPQAQVLVLEARIELLKEEAKVEPKKQ